MAPAQDGGEGTTLLLRAPQPWRHDSLPMALPYLRHSCVLPSRYQHRPYPTSRAYTEPNSSISTCCRPCTRTLLDAPLGPEGGTRAIYRGCQATAARAFGCSYNRVHTSYQFRDARLGKLGDVRFGTCCPEYTPLTFRGSLADNFQYATTSDGG